MSGEIPSAVDFLNHQFSPAVTNHKLADYLESEITSVSKGSMEPEISTALRPPHNVYMRLPVKPSPTGGLAVDSPSGAIEQSIHEELRARSKAAEDLTALEEKSGVLRQRNAVRFGPQRVSALLSDEAEGKTERWDFGGDEGYVSIFCDFLPKWIAMPRSGNFDFRVLGDLIEIRCAHTPGRPVLLYRDSRWTLVPHYPSVVASLHADLPGDVILVHSTEHKWDTSLSDYSLLSDQRRISIRDAAHLADEVRTKKHQYPHLSVMAAYLYEYANDIDNIARTAHYMASVPFYPSQIRDVYRESLVPFDLALLCAERIRYTEEDGLLVAYADLPAVPASDSNGYSEEVDGDIRPDFATRSFSAKDNVKLWGVAPVYRQGWDFLASADNLDLPHVVTAIASSTNGRSATSMNGAGCEQFAEFFKYRFERVLLDRHPTPSRRRVREVQGHG